MTTGGSSAPAVTTQTVNQDPWGPQQDYLKAGFGAAKEQYEGPKPQYFPSSTVTPFAPETEEAIDIRTAQARDPGGLIGGAETQLGKTISGDYLQPDNPVYKGLLEGVTSQVRPGVDTQFARSGRFGSPGHAEAMGRGIATGMSPYLNQERGRQLGAVSAAPQAAAWRPGILSQVGAQREGLAGAELSDAIARHDFEQNVDAAKLAQYMGNVTGGYGSGGITNTSQPTYSNPLMAGLGAGAGLAGIGNDLFNPKTGLFK